MAKSNKNDGGTATATAPAATEAKKAKKYETMIIGVSKANKPTRDALEKVAANLSCKPSALIWQAIENLVKNPPKNAPSGAAVHVGSASGFWTVVTKDSKHRANGIKVVEVATRGDVTAEDGGRTFFRFKKGDDKERNRAKNQALRAAQNDAGLIGYKGDITLEEIEEDTTGAEDTEATDEEDAEDQDEEGTEDDGDADDE